MPNPIIVKDRTQSVAEDLAALRIEMLRLATREAALCALLNSGSDGQFVVKRPGWPIRRATASLH